VEKWKMGRAAPYDDLVTFAACEPLYDLRFLFLPDVVLHRAKASGNLQKSSVRIVVVSGVTITGVRPELTRYCWIGCSLWKFKLKLTIQAGEEASVRGHLDSYPMNEGCTNSG